MQHLFSYANPYYNQDFIGFFQVLAARVFGFFTGTANGDGLAADELQLIVLSLVALSAALVGTTLILRKMAMLANSISHTILIGVVAAYFFSSHSGENHLHALNMPAFVLCSIGMAVLTAFLTEWLSTSTKLKEDASTGIVFTTFFAIGIIMVTLLTRSAHIGSEVVMGSADALHPDDVSAVFWIACFNAVMFLLCYKEFQITTFDPGLARSFGISPAFFNYVLMIQTALTAVAAFRAVGVIMVLAFLVGPALAARFLTDKLSVLFFYGAALGVGSSVLGVALARHLLSVYGLALSTGGLVVLWIALIFFACALFGPKRGILSGYFDRKRLRRQRSTGVAEKGCCS
ncbi:metal ABC transporter permease [Estrella lausannensis]|uniref:ABC-type transporter, permease subunit n=1 Tax=Estrella lausannensis TaxID=483423 RepID=A0A0H5DS04_9BACT|nr:metal ABC transporter permease [Estrella lausannensis]CRX39038.1 ABC-type transporter, permease subunit [Estrella lausannensis]